MSKETFDRTFALLKFDRDDLIEWLSGYFGLDAGEGTYVYTLMRSKSAFDGGTMTLDDFAEFDTEDITWLADFLLDKLRGKL